jgi:hypothetical protein
MNPYQVGRAILTNGQRYLTHPDVRPNSIVLCREHSPDEIPPGQKLSCDIVTGHPIAGQNSLRFYVHDGNGNVNVQAEPLVHFVLFPGAGAIGDQLQS